MTSGSETLIESVEKALQNGEDQYFFKPFVLVGPNGKPQSRINDGDSVIFCCRRGEREIQLTRAFVDPEFNEFKHEDWEDLYFATFTKYHEMFRDLPTVFPRSQGAYKGLGEFISDAGYRQLRVAESEKFNHITAFLNGGRNTPFPGEEQKKVPSYRGVPFDSVPEMKSEKVADLVIAGLESQEYHFIAVNFANGDVIGHINNFEAKVKCAEALDKSLDLVIKSAEKNGFTTIVSADHGVLEIGYHDDGSPNLHHTTNPVPFLMKHPDPNFKGKLKKGGILADITPTILEIMNISIPESMPRSSLLLNPPPHQGQDPRVLLIILDGWGIGAEDKNNPIYTANTPTYDQIYASWASTELKASGRAVGLLEGNPGNSEAGHSNIGAGQIILQDEVLIEESMRNGSFKENPIIREALEHVNHNNSTLHLISFLSRTSSHGTIQYPLEIVKTAKNMGLEKVKLHAIFNRPSGLVDSGPEMLRSLNRELSEIGLGEIVSCIGRGLALDRDGDYQKTKLAYYAFVYGIGKPSTID